MKTGKFLLEAIIVGIAIVIFGVVFKFILTKIQFIYRQSQQTQFIILLFLIGFGAHIFFEVFGINHMYCNYGYACTKTYI